MHNECQAKSSETRATGNAGHNRHSEYRTDRLRDNYVFVMSVSQLQKWLKQFAVMFSVNLSNLGFNMFRKYITTLLIGGGGHTLAQFVNAHSNVNMIITNYDLGTKNIIEKTMDDIIGRGRPFLGA